jgi:hypothetical protein
VNLLSVLICCWLWEVVVRERSSLSLPVCRVTREHTLLSAPRAARKGWDRCFTNPQIYLFYLFIYLFYLFIYSNSNYVCAQELECRTYMRSCCKLRMRVGLVSSDWLIQMILILFSVSCGDLQPHSHGTQGKDVGQVHVTTEVNSSVCWIVSVLWHLSVMNNYYIYPYMNKNCVLSWQMYTCHCVCILDKKCLWHQPFQKVF